jgi:hypothetical protein
MGEEGYGVLPSAGRQISCGGKFARFATVTVTLLQPRRIRRLPAWVVRVEGYRSTFLAWGHELERYSDVVVKGAEQMT